MSFLLQPTNTVLLLCDVQVCLFFDMVLRTLFKLR